MKVKAGVTGAYISFRNLVEISSGPVALCWFRQSQLITTIQDLASGIDSSTQIDAILLDSSNAFDMSHERLAAKLHHYVVRGPTLNAPSLASC
jgi:hypothetical protein